MAEIMHDMHTKCAVNEGMTHFIGDDCVPPHDHIGAAAHEGQPVLSKSEYRRIEVRKTSAWTAEEKEKMEHWTDTPPKPPEWVTAYTVGSSIYHEGWESFIRHVGQEDGHWLVLIEPVRKMNRADRRREGRKA